MIYTISMLAVALIVLATVTYRLVCRVQELDTRVRNGLDLQTEHLQGVVDRVNDKFDELDARLDTHREMHNGFVDFTKKELRSVDVLKDTVKAEIPRLVVFRGQLRIPSEVCMRFLTTGTQKT